MGWKCGRLNAWHMTVCAKDENVGYKQRAINQNPGKSKCTILTHSTGTFNFSSWNLCFICLNTCSQKKDFFLHLSSFLLISSTQIAILFLHLGISDWFTAGKSLVLWSTHDLSPQVNSSFFFFFLWSILLLLWACIWQLSYGNLVLFNSDLLSSLFVPGIMLDTGDRDQLDTNPALKELTV